MRVIVTGASGFIGKNFLLNAPKDWEIIAVYNNNKRFISFLKWSKLNNVEPIKCDLRSLKEVENLFSTHNDFDVCLYLASNTSTLYSIENPIADLETNTFGLLNFLKFFKGKKFIYVNSATVYEGNEGEVDVNTNVHPLIPYAISKLGCENYIKLYAKNFDYVIVRSFGVYGPYEDERKIFTRMIKEFSKKKKKFKIYGDGENLINCMYIKDFVNGVFKIIKSKKVNLAVDFYNGKNYSINELVKRVGEIFNIKVELVHDGESKEKNLFYCKSEDMWKVYKFKPRYSLKKGILKFAEFLKKN